LHPQQYSAAPSRSHSLRPLRVRPLVPLRKHTRRQPRMAQEVATPRYVSLDMRQPSLPILRRSLATLGALGGAVCMRSWDNSLPVALWLPTLLLASSAALIWRRHIGGQLLARAVWWSNLILGTLIATSGGSSERGIAALLALCTGGALIL